jgi:hypothetical protein
VFNVRGFLCGDSARAGHALRQAEDAPNRPWPRPHASPDRRCEQHLFIIVFCILYIIILFLILLLYK